VTDEERKDKAYWRLDKLLTTLDEERKKLIEDRSGYNDLRRTSDNTLIDRYIGETAKVAQAMSWIALGVKIPPTVWDRIGDSDDGGHELNG